MPKVKSLRCSRCLFRITVQPRGTSIMFATPNTLLSNGVSPIYMQISRAGLTLHLSEHHGDCCPDSTVFVRVTGLDDFHREITAKNYGSLRPGVEKTFYGSKCMEVIDPFGSRIRFDEPLPQAAEKPA